MDFGAVTMFLLAAALSLIVYCIMMLVVRYQYWKDRKIPYAKPLPIAGSILSVITMKQSMGEFYRDVYFKHPNERIVGVFELFKPVLMIRDPKLIERIFIKDFQYFTDRAPFAEDDGLFYHGLFQMKGSAWRSIRHKISPAFTSGKLKGMMNGMVDCLDQMITKIDENLDQDYEVREALAIFAINVIANTVFGIKIGNEQGMDTFIKYGTAIFNTTPARFVHTLLLIVYPELANLLGMKFMPTESTEYFKGFIKNILKQREKDKYQRNDFTQQLLNLKEQGAIEVQSNDTEDEYLNLDNNTPFENIEISDDLLAGQAFQFLSAGFDPILATMLYIMYDLARYPEVQDRVRNHVREVLEKHNGFSYACLQDMTVLEQCIQETARLYPIAPLLTRICTKNYYIPEEGLEIKKGQKLIVPLLGLHMDPKYYPDPEVYNPERFPPNVTRQNFTYLPFGDGPRLCIGLRYSMIVMKLGMAKILANYKFTLSDKTQVPFPVNKQSLLLMPKTKIFFKISKIVS